MYSKGVIGLLGSHPIDEKKIFRWQNGVEAGIHADIVPRQVL